LFQVEYAMEAISACGACLGITCKNGIVMVAENNIKSQLWVPERSEKFCEIDKHVLVAIAGITSDANILVDYAQRVAQVHRLTYNEPQPLEQIVHRLCDLTQSYTQFGGLRPFGVSMIWAGWNKEDGFQLFHSDPSGNFAEWSATAIGKNHKSAHSILKEEYKEGLQVNEGMELALQILTKTSDSPNLDPEQLEMFIMSLDENGVPQHKHLSTEDLKKNIDIFTKKEKAKKAKEELEKRKKLKKAGALDL